MAVIEIEGLKKVYHRVRGGTTTAVDGLDIEVSEGGVFGFLGPNGSGKTTSIRCLLGLIQASGGRTRLLGAEPPDLHTVIHRVGSIVEAPALFPTFTGARNLRLLGAHHGIGGADVARALERVGLAERGDDIVKHYSLGMKQRLGIAAALLKDPSLLILDEPANGLDPSGIKEVRELLRSLGNEGRTVFVSSHLLSEVQQVCDRVAILSRGRCIAAGPVTEVLASRSSGAMIVRAAKLERALSVLQDAGFDATDGDDHIRVQADPAEAEKITRALVAKRIYLTELRPVEVNLEDVFLSLTEGEETICASCGEPMSADQKFCTSCGAQAGGAA